MYNAYFKEIYVKCRNIRHQIENKNKIQAMDIKFRAVLKATRRDGTRHDTFRGDGMQSIH